MRKNPPTEPRFGRLVEHVPGKDEGAKIQLAREGLIPGAFQLGPNRVWWLDLEQWREHLGRLKRRAIRVEEATQ